MTQKIQIGQARAVLMPKGMQWFGMQQAIEYIPAERADLEKEAEQVRKEVYGDPPFGAPSNLRIRIPHFSAPADGLTGGKRRVGEVALAHGGLLVLSPVEEFSRSKLEEIAYVMKQGKDSNGRPARFAVLLGVQPETLTLPTGRARVEKALALFGTTLSEQNNSNGMTTMRGLIRQLEESSVKDSGSSEWVAQNLSMLAANFAQQATETYRGRGTAYPRKWYGKMEKVLAGNGFGPLNAKQLKLFDEAYERFMEAYASAGGQDLNVIERITKDITNRALALVRAS
jgi:hypothetical protein